VLAALVTAESVVLLGTWSLLLPEEEKVPPVFSRRKKFLPRVAAWFLYDGGDELVADDIVESSLCADPVDDAVLRRGTCVGSGSSGNGRSMSRASLEEEEELVDTWASMAGGLAGDASGVVTGDASWDRACRAAMWLVA
jgi:hypothetical protein